MKKNKALLLCIFVSSLLQIGCDDKSNKSEDNFDRQVMLTDWADLIIIPAFEVYYNSLEALDIAKNDFLTAKDLSSFNKLKEAYVNSYKSWQHVAMFDIGKAETIGLRNFTNIYPTDETLINKHIASMSYNLALPSNFDTQGFPALDYLLFGLSSDESEAIEILSSDKHSIYLSNLIKRLHELTAQVLDDWKTGYRNSFIENSGAGATASVDKLVNDFLFYFEKYLRAGKIGIPAGIFSGNELANAVEAPYSKIYSKMLLLESIESVRDFFIGNSFDDTSNGQSLQDYLLYWEEQDKAINLSSEILDQWQAAYDQSVSLGSSLKDQVLTDNSNMLMTYDELQKSVILLKVDMMQALNIQIDYVDADGD